MPLGNMAKRCEHCGSENLDYSYYCSKCSRELPSAHLGAEGQAAPTPVSPVSGGPRFCPSCGRSIQFDANVCPYCGHDFRWANSPPARDEALSDGMRILFYLLSALFAPIAGIILGIVFMMKPDPEYKRVGKNCLIISLVIGVVVPVVIFIVMFGTLMTVMP